MVMMQAWPIHLQALFGLGQYVERKNTMHLNNMVWWVALPPKSWGDADCKAITDLYLDHLTSPHIPPPHHLTSHHLTSHSPTHTHHSTSHHITSHHITNPPPTSHHFTSHDLVKCLPEKFGGPRVRFAVPEPESISLVPVRAEKGMVATL